MTFSELEADWLELHLNFVTILISFSTDTPAHKNNSYTCNKQMTQCTAGALYCTRTSTTKDCPCPQTHTTALTLLRKRCWSEWGPQTVSLAHVLEIFKTGNSRIPSLLCFKMLSPPWM